jgi:hypothetical protein
MRHERTPSVLRRAYLMEADPEVKAQMMRVAASLMSDVGEELLSDGLKSPVPRVRQIAEQIMKDRAAAVHA